MRYKGSYLSYILTYFFYFLAMALFSSVLSVYLTEIGKTATEMSFIISAAGLFSFVMLPVVGYLNDLTQRPKLISGILLLLVGLLGLAFSASRNVFVLFLLDGIIMSFINSVMPICERMAGISKYRYGSIRIWGTFGYAAGAQFAGLAIQHFPPIFLFILLMGATILTVVGFIGTENISMEEDVPDKPAKKPPLSSLFKNRQFFLFMVVASVFSACSGVNMNYTPILLTGMGVPTGSVGTVLFFSTLVEIPLILFSHKYMDRFSGKSLMAVSFTIIIVQFLFYSFTGSAVVVVTVMILLKAVASTLFVMINLKMVRNLVRPELTTTGLALISSANSLATILMQNIAGVIVDNTGIQTLYMCMAVLTALGLGLNMLLKVKNSEKVFG